MSMSIPALKDIGNVESIVKLVGSLAVIILMVVTYTYIQKLERIACQCSIHPYRNYIKNYILFAIVFLLFTMFVTPATAAKMFGSSFALVMSVVEVLFVIGTFVFFVYAIMYVNYLMKEKCKCSEDMRREVLYVWSILHMTLISITFLLPWVIGLTMSSLGLLLSASKDFAAKGPAAVRQTMVAPFKSVRGLPASLKKTGKMFRK
jgi:flagellar biogenesis protein FliO